ncbi:HAMP domain-containing sensor histidine kinase [Marmoricola sp. RAF53]|uniref:HAMP domain-containing sensor histidine kinase n=1 Tax=Marmoricola sp. RAF53 TaxID=3233059 RepID=UPI003F98845C
MSLLERAASSMRVRITAVATLFVLLVTVAGSVLVVLAIGHSIGQGLVSSARQDAQAIDAQLASGVKPAAAATTGRHDVVVQLVGPDGTVVASDRPELTGEPLRTRTGVTGTAVVGGLQDKFTLVAVDAGAAARAASGVDRIVVGRSTETRDETRAEAAGVLAVAVTLVVLALAVVVWVSVGRALRPVEVMREEASTITATHLRRRLAVPAGSDEVPRLARTLNEMLDRIDEGQERQRQFVSDASHELRTPLAVIRQSAEVARAHPDRFDVQRLADDVLAESLRLEDLVSTLLLLARVESAAEQPVEDVDVDDLVLAEVTRARATAPAHVTIDASAVGAGRTRGNPLLLAQVVGNLLSNAVRHARSEVRVSLAEKDGRVLLRVDDDGNGIPSDQREAVFERFIRLDDARDRDAGGTGLGLAIVRSVVEGAGGDVRAEEAPAGGARLIVRLPATE